MINLLTALLLGILMILDPCTLFTSIAAIGYIDKEITNQRRVLRNGAMFVLGKLATYTLLAIPFIMGARTEGIQHLLQQIILLAHHIHQLQWGPVRIAVDIIRQGYILCAFFL